MHVNDEDPYDLRRFLLAQEDIYPKVIQELTRGQKTSHWMWYIFPQIEGLGASAMAMEYALHSIDEAHAYLRHGVLGSRLAECTSIVNALSGHSAYQIFGPPDDKKFFSSMTLFDYASGGRSVYAIALEKYFENKKDVVTLRFLEH